MDSSLVLLHVQEGQSLLELIASLLPDDEAPAHDEVTVVRSPSFLSRWIPNWQN
ncbi:hypothetical protein MKL09_26650 [Methylobacterium sp. J-048]|uniref:hypothetical protein n=1 Tax=Methylobacterium sp. J-048 TaxID=2836635 RepID=UPI001FB94E2E|nr:hypothetical protein [Methylobacterium sp. J-048]MCJ2060098.1 hypothetical protein [Methylobacterium sp. J-048]